jgi:hypothetical protein
MLPQAADGQAAHDAQRQPQQVVGHRLGHTGIDQRRQPVRFHRQPRGRRQLRHRGVGRRLQATLDGQVQRDQEQFAEEELLRVGRQPADGVVHRVRAACAPTRLFRRTAKHMLDHRHHQRVLGREVVRLRALADTGGQRHVGGAQARVAALAQQGDRGVQDAPACVFAAFGLRAPHRGSGRRSGRGAHSIVLPPLTLMTCPVTKDASRDARYSTIDATSSSSAARPIGMTPRKRAARSGWHARTRPAARCSPRTAPPC